MVSGGGAKSSIQESGARLKAPQRNAITGFGDRKAIEIPVVLMPQAESLSVNSDKQSDMFQRVGDDVGIASGVQELIRDVEDNSCDGCCSKRSHGLCPWFNLKNHR